MDEEKIQGGAVIFARQTTDSDIFTNRPDVWFKIWFYIISKATHKNNGKLNRGQCFLKYQWIEEATQATHDQVKHCVDYLKHATMIATQKTTRGMIITIIKYDYFQNLDNYSNKESHTESHKKATQKPHRSHTIYKNDKNDKNDKNNTIGVPNEVFSLKEEIKKLEDSPRREFNIMALYFDRRNPDIQSKAQLSVAVKRHLRPAIELKPFTDTQIIDAVPKAKKLTDGWTLETLIKILCK